MTSPLTPQEYEELVAAIVNAVPEIMQPHAQPYGEDILKPRPITLEDVLRANVSRSGHQDLAVDESGHFWVRASHGWIWQGEIVWHLGLPLSKNPQAWPLLHSLLCK